MTQTLSVRNQGASTNAPVACARDLRLSYHVRGATVHALRGASLEVRAREAVGLLGESGSGKSTLARALIGLLPINSVAIEGGAIEIDGQDVTAYGEADWRRLRGQTVAMVFQDPLTYLNPVMRVGRQMAEAIRAHEPGTNVRSCIRELLDLVHLPTETEHAYAHELSGGMRQRALLAIALSCRPKLLLADEPTTALDVTTQAAILDLLNELRRELGMALLLVSHDLAVLAGTCSRVYVMYAGQVIEEGPTDEVFRRPIHPYTIGLLKAAEVSRGQSGRFATIDGRPPNLAAELIGCPFKERCAFRMPVCETMPGVAVSPSDDSHRARCWIPLGSASNTAS